MSGYPESGALSVWEHGGATCSMVRTDRGHLCGYARFPKRELLEDGYHGIVTYVPVHGGVTYAAVGDDGSMVYGFDCSHSGDAPPMEYERHPQYRDADAHVWTEAEVQIETERMADALAAAPAFEERYLRGDNEERAAVLVEFHEAVGQTLNVTDNFGVMVNVLFGGL